MKTGKGQHKEVWVKVNAPVDEGVAPLVAALSDFEGVCTAASCQGHSPKGEESQATVFFTYARGNPSDANCWSPRLRREPAEFAMWLGNALREAVSDDAEVTVSYSHNPPLLVLLVRRTAVEGVADVLRDLAKEPPKLAV